jgi:hypothetical protein
MIFTSFAALCAFALTCYGWGRLAFDLVYRGRPPLHAYATGLGLVVLLFIGGILNTTRLATTLSLSICAYAGMVLAICFIVRTAHGMEWRSLIPGRRSTSTLCLLVLIVAAVVFLVTQLLPTQFFNPADDFFSYMVRPIRMQTTGSLGGNPFELLGMSDFGAQSYLQSFLLLWLPLTDLPAFDTIFCFLLGMILLVEIGRMNAAPWPLVALGVALYVAINPQLVNLSSVYSTTVVVLTLLMAAGILLSQAAAGASPARLAAYTMPLGGSLAALIALKLSSAFFVGTFFAIFFGLAVLSRVAAAASSAIAAAAAACIALAPWVLAHLDKLDMTRWSSTPVELLASPLTRHPGVLELFRDGSGAYGATRSQYILAVVVILLSLFAGVLALFQRSQQKDHLLRVATDAAGLATYVGLALVVNNEDALRYSCPFLIALVSSRLLFPLVPQVPGVSPPPRFSSYVRAALAVAQVGLVLIFAGPLIDRLSRIIKDHTTISFPFNPAIREYEATTLSDDTQAYIRSIQAKAPPGSTIWAWIDAPFQLDFARNRIWHFHHTWFVTPWRLNASNGEGLRQQLSSRGVDFILWQYRSVPTPRVPHLRAQLQQAQWVEFRLFFENTLALLLALEALATPFDVVYGDANMVLIRIKRDPS